jgi:hypothetical protein
MSDIEMKEEIAKVAQVDEKAQQKKALDDKRKQ